VGQKPVFGWGLERYGILNTWDHRTCCGIDWIRGYGDIGHDTELAIAVELGLVGLAVWVAVLVAIAVGSRRAWRILPVSGLLSRRLVLAFWCAVVAWFINESFIDMRLFPYVDGVIFAWAGMVIGLADLAEAREVEPARSPQLSVDPAGP
jgi:O-antigen ligase